MSEVVAKKTGGNPRPYRRKIVVPKTIKTTRDMIRQHLREEGMGYAELSEAWSLKLPAYSKHRLWLKNPLSPGHIEAFIALVKLDEFDALELRLQAAIEAGWQLSPLSKNILS